MANIREFSSSMSTPQSGSANLNINVNGATTSYNPFGPDRTVNIDTTGGGADVFINAPVNLDAVPIETYNEGTAGQAKYIKCMELVGNGQLPICTARHDGPSGTHGSFGPLSYITNHCELYFSFPKFDDYSSMILQLNSSGVWSKVT